MSESVTVGDSHSIETWKRDLEIAGWKQERFSVWKDPEGNLWRGPYGAWRELQRRKGAQVQ